MAFKLNTSDSFWFSVKVVQILDSGNTVEDKIRFKFKRLSLDERRERERRMGGELYQQLLAECDGDADAVSGRFTAELIRSGQANKTSEEITSELMDIVCGWESVTENGEELPFSEANLLRLVQVLPNLAGAINDAYRQAYSGELKKGN